MKRVSIPLTLGGLLLFLLILPFDLYGSWLSNEGRFFAYESIDWLLLLQWGAPVLLGCTAAGWMMYTFSVWKMEKIEQTRPQKTSSAKQPPSSAGRFPDPPASLELAPNVFTPRWILIEDASKKETNQREDSSGEVSSPRGR